MEWRDVAGFEGDYQVSDTGLVRSRKTGHYRNLKVKHNHRTGYDFVNLYNSTKLKTRTIHRLVAEAFIPNPDNLPEVNHIDEDKTNNNVTNLEWVTSHENNVHSKHKREKAISIYSVDEEKLGTFKSGVAASNVLGVEKSAVCRAARGGAHTCAGFVLVYE